MRKKEFKSTKLIAFQKLCREFVDIQAATGNHKYLAGLRNTDLKEEDVEALAAHYQSALTQLELKCREELDYHPNPTEFHYEDVEEYERQEKEKEANAESNKSVSDDKAPRPIKIDRGKKS